MKQCKFLLILVLLLCMPVVAAAAAIPTISVEELQPGMHGYAKTVIKGVNIETFDVEVLGVTGSDVTGHNILIKASGPLIERSGGIAQGMSGSPVYIDGRLAGAVAYGKAFSDPNYCFLTPIGEMLKMFDNYDPRPAVFLPKNTPLMVSGFTDDGIKYLSDKLLPMGLKTYAVPTGNQDLSKVALEPGSSIGVELVRGDMSIGAIGTVTWKDDETGRILAFGHPFLQRGVADYFMTNAWIFASIPNMESAFKVGALGNLKGRISQDRATGIAGQLKENPKIIPMFVSATDKDRGLHKTATVQLITDEDLVPSLVDSICYNVFNKTVDRKGGGTSHITFNITARGENSGQINLRRENMFYNSNDIAKATNGELAYACDMLMKNKFEKVTIFAINVDVEATSDFEVAEIVSAKIPKEKFKPGGTIPLLIEFKPYRAKNFTKEIAFKVPETQKPGPMNIVIRGGNAYAWLTKLIKKQQEAKSGAPVVAKRLTLKEFLDEFNEADSNNEIVVDILPNTHKKVGEQASESKETTPVATNLQSMMKGSKYKQKYPLKFIANGDIEMTVVVGKK
ncbi:MAG: SpoIVB peptidase S55 domain-containing protein [Acidaminococcaceae bacterium]|nr:SpoIVB peptidase S55 domain-containing protein [Acidaminococcaceae bacterium]